MIFGKQVIDLKTAICHHKFFFSTRLTYSVFKNFLFFIKHKERTDVLVGHLALVTPLVGGHVQLFNTISINLSAIA